MRLLVSERDIAYLRTLGPGPRRAIRVALGRLQEDPRHPGLSLKQLRVEGEYRLYRARIGDYRIVFTPRPAATYVWRIQHRSEGYGWLERLDPGRETV